MKNKISKFNFQFFYFQNFSKNFFSNFFKPPPNIYVGDIMYTLYAFHTLVDCHIFPSPPPTKFYQFCKNFPPIAMHNYTSPWIIFFTNIRSFILLPNERLFTTIFSQNIFLQGEWLHWNSNYFHCSQLLDSNYQGDIFNCCFVLLYFIYILYHKLIHLSIPFLIFFLLCNVSVLFINILYYTINNCSCQYLN